MSALLRVCARTGGSAAVPRVTHATDGRAGGRHRRVAMSESPRLITQIHSPEQRRMGAWRTAADEVWRSWEQLRRAPRPLRAIAYELHLDALDAEARAATGLGGDIAAP